MQVYPHTEIRPTETCQQSMIWTDQVAIEAHFFYEVSLTNFGIIFSQRDFIDFVHRCSQCIPVLTLNYEYLLSRSLIKQYRPSKNKFLIKK